MFSDDMQQFISVVNHLRHFKPDSMMHKILPQPSRTLLTEESTSQSSGQYQILPYSVSATVVGASEDYRGAGGYLQAVCNDFDSDSWYNFATMINGACAGMSTDGEPNNPLSSLPLFQRLCASESLSGSFIPGDVQSPSGAESLLGFLSDSKKLITLGANSPVDLSWTSIVAESRAFDVELKYSRTLTEDLSLELGIKIFGVKVEAKGSVALTQHCCLPILSSLQRNKQADRNSV